MQTNRSIDRLSHLQPLEWHRLLPSEAAAAAEEQDRTNQDHSSDDRAGYNRVQMLLSRNRNCTIHREEV